MPEPDQKRQPAVLVFDVNETLLDLGPLVAVFGDETTMRTWYAQAVIYSQSLTLAGHYVPFGTLGAAVWRMLATGRGETVGDDRIEALRETVATLPPHPDVRPGLERLRAAGFRLAALTNNAVDVVERQLAAAGLSELFERAFSVDTPGVQQFKPAPATYRSVERGFGVPAEICCLVACHAWDTLGAVACGWQAALLTRSPNGALVVGPQPGWIVADVSALADVLTG